MTGHVTCFGEVLIRFATHDARLVVQSDTLDMMVGGAEANVASGLASLGHKVHMVSRLPANPLGDKARAALGSSGVDLSGVTSGPGRMGLYFLETGAGLRPSAITYDRAGSAFIESSVEDFDFASAFDGAKLLHVSGITPALSPRGVELCQAAVRSAREAGVPICFDGNYRALLWESWDSDPRKVLNELVASATIMIGNHRDISLLLGKSFTGEDAEHRREAAEAAFAAFPDLQVIASTARQVVNAGHHRIAARIDGRDRAAQTPEVDVTDIVDRIGTGDAFAAGVLHQWLEGGDLAAMAHSGLAYTVLKHSIHGDRNLIRRAELDAFSLVGSDVRR